VYRGWYITTQSRTLRKYNCAAACCLRASFRVNSAVRHAATWRATRVCSGVEGNSHRLYHQHCFLSRQAALAAQPCLLSIRRMPFCICLRRGVFHAWRTSALRVGFRAGAGVGRDMAGSRAGAAHPSDCAGERAAWAALCSSAACSCAAHAWSSLIALVLSCRFCHRQRVLSISITSVFGCATFPVLRAQALLRRVININAAGASTSSISARAATSFRAARVGRQGRLMFSAALQDAQASSAHSCIAELARRRPAAQTYLSSCARRRWTRCSRIGSVLRLPPHYLRAWRYRSCVFLLPAFTQPPPSRCSVLDLRAGSSRRSFSGLYMLRMR